MKLITDFDLVPKLTVRGDIPPLSLMLAWWMLS